ncbi:MBG domain-containing protein [Akkermansiaceae bacterium]|nr:MBG domain-containing protein [Akkermansiaceae bacterium]
MNPSVPKFPSRSGTPSPSILQAAVLVGAALLCQFALAVPAEVFINQTVQEYNGDFKFPNIATDPPGLSVDVTIAPRVQSEVVFQTIPVVAEPSYSNFGLESLPGDKVFGEEINLGGTERFLESVDVTMVNVARASNWLALAAENPAGYLHPVSIIIYRVDGVGLTLLAQKTQQALVPWNPDTLDDGSDYPYGGIGFNVRIDFNERVLLSERLVVMAAYNTQSSGFEPIGLPGPYNDLKVALEDYTPLVGSDVDETRMIRFTTGVVRSRAFGERRPIFTVRAFSAEPAPGTPLDAGGYRVSATISQSGFEGSAVANLQVTPLEAEISLANFRQVADGTPKSISFTTIPAGLNADIVYARRSDPPLDRGLYPAFVTLNSVNYIGKSSRTMRLGYSFASWIAERVSSGAVSPALAGKSDDPDFDGRNNFMEYLASTNPGAFNAGEPPTLRLTKGGDQVMLGFVRNNDAIDVDYQLQATEDLGDPASWSNLTLPAEGTAPFVLNEEIMVPSPLSPSVPAKFFRLKFTTPEP